MGIEVSTLPADIFELTLALLQHWWVLLFGPLAIGVATLGASYLITAAFSARTSSQSPQQWSMDASTLPTLRGPSRILDVAVAVKVNPSHAQRLAPR